MTKFLLNYQQCGLQAFNRAMDMAAETEPADIGTQDLYIIATKHIADAESLKNSKYPSLREIAQRSRIKAQQYIEELERRGVSRGAIVRLDTVTDQQGNKYLQITHPYSIEQLPWETAMQRLTNGLSSGNYTPEPYFVPVTVPVYA